MLLISRILEHATTKEIVPMTVTGTELLSSDSEYDSDSHTSISKNNSDSDSDDSETDGFVEHSFELLFVPDDDIQQVSVRL